MNTHKIYVFENVHICFCLSLHFHFTRARARGDDNLVYAHIIYSYTYMQFDDNFFFIQFYA